MYELRMCSRSFFGTIFFAAWEKIFHLDYQQRYFVSSAATFYVMTIIKLLNTIHVLAVFLQVSKSDSLQIMLGNFCGRYPRFQISVTILNHCAMTHTLLSGKQGKNIVIVLTHSEWNPSLGLQTGENSGHYVRQKISSAELGLLLIGSLRVSSTHLKHVNAML